MTAHTWAERYPADQADDLDPAGSFIAALTSWHDDKREGRPDMHIDTQPGDLDCAGRPLRAGS